MNTPTPNSANALPKVVFEQYSAWHGKIPALRDVNLKVFAGERLAIIGPAGSGKTTLLRSLNRWHDLIPDFRHQGRILIDGQDIFSHEVDVALLRQRIGMVSAAVMPLPGSIYDNIALAIQMAGERDPGRIRALVESGLKGAFLWDEVKDRLQASAWQLSPGNQRRLNLARALALDPEVLLLDEPCAGLDNLAATALEDTLEELKSKLVVAFATNDIKQAARASDRTAFFLHGELVEWGETWQVFTQPAKALTADFIMERF
jgi:phosphate transport system ATP-binding protein